MVFTSPMQRCRFRPARAPVFDQHSQQAWLPCLASSKDHFAHAISGSKRILMFPNDLKPPSDGFEPPFELLIALNVAAELLSPDPCIFLGHRAVVRTRVPKTPPHVHGEPRRSQNNV
jgi:hypothetical protein